jgi:hypothetical protein
MCFRDLETILGAVVPVHLVPQFVVRTNLVDLFGKEYRMEITRSRPTGISIIAVLVCIQAALEIIYGLLVLIAAPGFVTSSGTAVIVQVSPWGFLISGLLAFLIGGTIQLFSAYYPWAVLLSMVIPAVILIYFFADRNVREAFNVG